MHAAVSLATEGYCQGIAVDTYDNFEEDVTQLVSLLKRCVPQSNFYRIVNNILSTQVAQEILKCSSFGNDANIYNRHKNAVFYGKISIIY